jgi:hypothetical protein
VRRGLLERIERNADLCRRGIEAKGEDADQRRVERLLTIIATAEQALFHETRGRLGGEHANTVGVEARLRGGR